MDNPHDVDAPEGDSEQVAAHAVSTLTSLAHIITGTEQHQGIEEPQGDLNHEQLAQIQHEQQQMLQEHLDVAEGKGEEPNPKRLRAASYAQEAAGDGVHPPDASQQQQEGGYYSADMQAAAAAIAAASAGGGLTVEAIASRGFTAEQLAALQSMPMVTPEMLAAAMQPPAGTEGGVQLPMLGEMPQFLDPAALGMGMDMLQNLSPEQLQAFLANTSGLQQFFLPSSFPIPGGGPGGAEGTPGADASASTYKNWWDEKDEQELMRLGTDPEYRLEKLGVDEMDWGKLETYFRRSQNALRKKFWMLNKGRDGSGVAASSPPDLSGGELDQQALSAAAAVHAAQMVAASAPPMTQVGQPSAQPRPRAPRKKWNDEETREMEKIVVDAVHRMEQGLQDPEAEEVSYERLAARFGCSLQTAKRKYRHLQEQAAQGGGSIPEKGKRQHFRKSVPYRWMIVSALSKISGFESTAPQIFENIEADPELRNQLDTRIMPGTKHVPRWKIQVRKVLSADHIFINTGVKQKHETIWRLDPVALQEANADRQRQRAGVPPISLAGVDQLAGGSDLPAGDLSAMQLQIDQGAMAMLHQQQIQQLMSLQQHQMQLGDGSSMMPHMLTGLEGGMMDPAMAAAMASAAAAAVGMEQDGGQGEGGGEQQYQQQYQQDGKADQEQLHAEAQYQQQQQEDAQYQQQHGEVQYQQVTEEQFQQLTREQQDQLMGQQQQLVEQQMLLSEQQQRQQIEQQAAEVAVWQATMEQHNASMAGASGAQQEQPRAEATQDDA